MRLERPDSATIGYSAQRMTHPMTEMRVDGFVGTGGVSSLFKPLRFASVEDAIAGASERSAGPAKGVIAVVDFGPDGILLQEVELFHRPLESEPLTFEDTFGTPEFHEPILMDDDVKALVDGAAVYRNGSRNA